MREVLSLMFICFGDDGPTAGTTNRVEQVSEDQPAFVSDEKINPNSDPSQRIACNVITTFLTWT